MKMCTKILALSSVVLLLGACERRDREAIQEPVAADTQSNVSSTGPVDTSGSGVAGDTGTSASGTTAMGTTQSNTTATNTDAAGNAATATGDSATRRQVNTTKPI